MPVRIAELLLHPTSRKECLKVVAIANGLRLEGPTPRTSHDALDLSALLRCLREVREVCRAQAVEVLHLRPADFDPLDPETLRQVVYQIIPFVRVEFTP